MITNGLAYCLDAANVRSYPGSGTTWTDLSGNGRTGTLTNGPSYNSSNGGSIVFDGVNDYVSIGSSTYTLNAGVSMEMWVYLTARDRNQGFMSLNSGGAGPYINFWMPSGNTMRWEVIGTTASGYSTINSTTTFAINTWYHVVGTANLTNTYIYVNGALETSQSMSNQPTSITATGYIGNYETSYPSASRIAMAKVYTRPLSADEVTQNFNSLRTRFGI
jgi:hypothetical protein